MPTAPETLLRAQVKAALAAAFPSLTVLDDRLHESLGHAGAVAGVSPEEASPGSNQQVLEPEVLVQVYHAWDKRIDPEQTVDPAPIEAAAETFREQIRERQSQGAANLWFLGIRRLWYPNDPTGNKTRFHALVRGRANNTAGLLETTP